MTPDLIAGIDLGTTNSAIAVMRDGTPQIIAIDGAPAMPSCVGLDADGTLLVGQPALNQLSAAPDRTITSIKRLMGTTQATVLGEDSYSPEEISALILKKLKQGAEESLGQPLHKAVITVPAYFDDNQRRATQQAATLAGLEAVRIINEPTAAALAYNLQSNEDKTVLIYDFGGGTFDVSIVRCKDGIVEVCASHGDTQLGGDDLDEAFYHQILQDWEHKDQADLQDARVSRRLLLAAQAAKCALSDEAYYTMQEDYLTDQHHLQSEVSRPQFQTVIQPLVNKTLTSIQLTLQQAGLAIGDIDQIVLVGGSTRIPLVQELIEQRIGKAPSREVDPDLIVTLGAAIQGGIIAGDDIQSILVDISAHTFSTSSLDANYDLICRPIIKRGTPLPVTRSEVFYTTVDDQEEIQIEAYQGESTVPGDNLLLGSFSITDLQNVRANSPVIIRFSLDLNGVLKVNALDKASGQEKSSIIDTRQVTASAELDEARQRIANIFGDAEDTPQDAPGSTAPAPSAELIKAKELKTRAEACLLYTSDAADD